VNPIKMPHQDPSSSRKTKRDKRAKANYNKYKKGGSQRVAKLSLKNENHPL